MSGPDPITLQPFAKQFLGLVVIDQSDHRIRSREALLRNLLHPVDLIGFYLLGFLTVLVTDRRQGLGDLVAGTYAIRRPDTGSS